MACAAAAPRHVFVEGSAPGRHRHRRHHTRTPFRSRHRVVVVAARAEDKENTVDTEKNEEEDDHVVHVYPEGDWRNEALRGSLSDKERVWREAQGRNFTYMLKIVYDGERYLGFQYQPPPLKTVQGEVEKALTKLTGEGRDFLAIQASGRTDTGVHARGQVLHFYTRELIPDLVSFKRSMNGVMPDDVRVEEVRRPHPAFHARFHAVRKTYHYYLDTRPALDPFTRRHALHVGWRPPDMDRLRAAAAVLVGTHDFSAFANKSRDKTVVRDPVRTIYRFDVVDTGELIRLEVEGNGFLYRGVRNMVGAMLVAASSTKSGPEDLKKILDGKDRRGAPMGAPAHGLFLHEVVYPEALLNWEPPPDEEKEEEQEEEKGDRMRSNGQLAVARNSSGLRAFLNS